MPASRSLLCAGLVIAALLVIGRAARRQQARQQVAVRRVEVEGGDGPILGVRVGEQDDAGRALRAEEHLKACRDRGLLPHHVIVGQSHCLAVPECSWFVAYTSLDKRGADHA